MESSANKYILYGTGRRCRRIIKELSQCEEMVLFAVDINAAAIAEGSFPFPVYTPDCLLTDKYEGNNIVITVADKTGIYESLKENYHIPGKNIITVEQWISECIKTKKIYLKPKSIRIDICTLCQLDCLDCYMRTDEKNTIGAGYVSADIFESFLEKYPFIRSIEISNSGEPFLNPELHEILTAAYMHGVEITISNGANFNYVSDEVLHDLVSKSVTKLTISIDGASQEVYSIYRRKGNFDTVIENIKKLNLMKKQYHTELPAVTWQFVVMEHNICDIEKAKTMAEELKMSIEFKASWNQKEAEKVQKIYETNTISFSDREKSITENKHVNLIDYTDLYCRELLYSPQVNWDGRLLGCCTVNGTDWGMNVFEQGLLECINSDIYLKTIACLLENKLPPARSVCANCSMIKKYRNVLKMHI